MKKLTLSLLLSLPLFTPMIHARNINLGEQNETIRNAIAFVDGHLGRINGNTIGIMIEVAQKIQDIQHGNRDPQNRALRIGKFVFNGKAYSIAELANIESQYVGNPELNALLVEAKRGFEDLVAQFIGQASGTKDILIMLIQESCHRRDRKNSLLLTWASAPDGHETVIFHTEVQSFKALNDFCQDLTHFLGDLTMSCPKACEQFKQKQAEYAKGHNK